jgi:hypothetical protein
VGSRGNGMSDLEMVVLGEIDTIVVVAVVVVVGRGR